jgi:hypothetical protein
MTRFGKSVVGMQTIRLTGIKSSITKKTQDKNTTAGNKHHNWPVGGRVGIQGTIGEAQARELVASLEKFIDENIRSALRQHVPEFAPLFWDMNDLHNAREALVRQPTKHLL